MAEAKTKAAPKAAAAAPDAAPKAGPKAAAAPADGRPPLETMGLWARPRLKPKSHRREGRGPKRDMALSILNPCTSVKQKKWPSHLGSGPLEPWPTWALCPLQDGALGPLGPGPTWILGP